MRLILQLCLWELLLLGAEQRAWSKVATSPQTAVRGWGQNTRQGGGSDAPPRQLTSGEAAAWDADRASAGDIHRDDTLTMAGPVVVTFRGAAFLMCPGAPPPFIGSFRTTTPVWVPYGPNVYAYVKQNPWTSWDPHGLATKSQLHKQRRALIQRRDAEKAVREKNGEKLTEQVHTGAESVTVNTEYGNVMNTFNTAIDALESRITAIDRAVSFHNGVVDAMGALTGGKHSSFRLSRVQFDDEDPKNQVFLRNGNRAVDLRNEAAMTLLTAGAGKLISIGGKAMKLLSPAAKTVSTVSDDVVKLYHQGTFRGGQVSSTRGLSTSPSPSPDLSHYRPGGQLYEFQVPRNIYNQWLDDGLAMPKNDLHLPTGVVRPEIRVLPPASGSLNQYLVRPAGG